MKNQENEELNNKKDNSKNELITIFIILSLIWIAVDCNFVTGPDKYLNNLKGGFVGIAVLGILLLLVFIQISNDKKH
jgi:hypothetical protein